MIQHSFISTIFQASIVLLIINLATLFLAEIILLFVHNYVINIINRQLKKIKPSDRTTRNALRSDIRRLLKDER